MTDQPDRLTDDPDATHMIPPDPVENAATAPPPPQAPGMHHVLRFGEKAIELRLLSVDQVEEALAAQEDGRRRGIDRSVGAWCHDRGYLDLVQVQSILATLGEHERSHLVPDIELLSLLGRGTSGAVYLGRLISLAIEVAVKIRAPRRESDDPNAARFKLEAKLGERLVHPNIVRLYSAGETRDYTYHVLEYVDGQPLDRLLRAETKLPEAFVAEVGMQCAAALECAAAEGIVHRDIKPANILITRQGQAKLCDLGLAKDLLRGTFLTADGVLLGSPFYLAPEYAKTGEVDAQSDVYSLGVTLYHCATGYVPFPGKTAMEILQRVVRDEAPDARTYVASLSDGFVNVVKKMMAKEPTERYKTASEAREALARVVVGVKPDDAIEPPKEGTPKEGSKRIFPFWGRK